MVSYWERQHIIDVISAAALTGLNMASQKFGLPTLITISTESLVLSSRAWVGPALTLLGMMSATTAFIFSVVDRSEFTALRKLGVEPQLWKIFSENLTWLAIAAVSAILMSFMPHGRIPDLILTWVIFLFIMVCICLAKFVWVMRQIISVRSSR